MTPEPRAASNPGGHNVLIVEDDTELSRLMRKVFEQEGFHVDVVEDGASAIESSKTLEPDVILLDYELPDMTGQMVCRTLRTFTDTYIVMVTARDSEIDKVVSLSIGADDYVTKPFSHRELIARVHTLLRRPRHLVSGSDQQRRFGDLTIDVASHEVRYRGELVELTKLEFEMLDLLSSNTQTVLSRPQLLQQVWKTEWTNDDHLIDTHIHNLRRKLRDAGMQGAWITTVRGVGYRFVPQDGE